MENKVPKGWEKLSDYSWWNKYEDEPLHIIERKVKGFDTHQLQYGGELLKPMFYFDDKKEAKDFAIDWMRKNPKPKLDEVAKEADVEGFKALVSD